MKKLFFITLISLMSSTWVAAQSTYIFVRHAEKESDGTPNPNLTVDGHKRAVALANFLKNQPVDAIYSTDYLRTMQTAGPLAKMKDIKIDTYNPADQANFAQMLKEKQDQVITVVGHSNTIHHLVNFMMGEKVLDELDESDYENIFMVYLDVEAGKKSLLRLQYPF
ncbi:SixA phosphatase family protein [Penaeicola halotolerans]|uniref:SixA phosphatase family protein n=1 Tax=Penaeicola halotolerans TaxID=2793196 RepID=UPI001CF90680|nr:phosphoglycerate mutase family protein [Penaeicola halotolerans]